MSILVVLVVVLSVAEVIVVHQVTEGLGGDGHHVGQNHPAVTAAGQHQLIMRVVVANAPHPGWWAHTHTKRISEWVFLIHLYILFPFVSYPFGSSIHVRVW